MAENLSYNPYRDMHNDVQFSAMFFGKNIQNIPVFNPTQTIEVKRLYCSLERFTFTGKERDSETGFSYFGARYYDSDILTSWLSVDPMADKYPNISPYAYCAWNPVKLVDPDGKDWDLSNLTETQKEIFDKNVDFLSQKSPLFKEIYNQLTASSIVYSVSIGQTQGNAPAQYNESNNSFTFQSEVSLNSKYAFVEEVTHACQLTENKHLYNSNSFNYEFEAKVITTLILYESNRLMGNISGMEKYQNKIMNYYNAGIDIDSKVVNSYRFLQEYRSYANLYSQYNKQNNIGNSNYKRSTLQSPASLINLIQKVRP